VATLVALSAGCGGGAEPPAEPSTPYVLVLGIAQDGGVPQVGSDHPGWDDPDRRERVAALALVDPASGGRWLFDATPDLPEQLHALDRAAPSEGPKPGLQGIFLTHAHIGHYTGLMFLGHEALGASGVPVFAMPRMASFLSSNGPWSQLVTYGNIRLLPLDDGVPVAVSSTLRVTPLRVPHRQEYADVVGYRIDGPDRSLLYVPDIDSWEAWDTMGTRIEEVVRSVDVALVDGTFFANGEIPGRDMTGFPHPFVTHSMARLASLPADVRSRIRFIHLNHTNRVLVPGSDERRAVLDAGFGVAAEGDRHPL